MAESKPKIQAAPDQLTEPERYSLIEHMGQLEEFISTLQQSMLLVQRVHYLENQADTLARKVEDLQREFRLWSERVEQIKMERRTLVMEG